MKYWALLRVILTRFDQRVEYAKTETRQAQIRILRKSLRNYEDNGLGIGTARTAASSPKMSRQGGGLFLVGSQYLAGCRIHQVHLSADDAGDRLIGVGVVSHFVSDQALNFVTGSWAAVEESRHVRSWGAHSLPGDQLRMST